MLWFGKGEDLIVKSRHIKRLTVVVRSLGLGVGRVDCPFLENFVCVINGDCIRADFTIGGINLLDIIEEEFEVADEDGATPNIKFPFTHCGMIFGKDIRVHGMAIVPHRLLNEHSFNVRDGCLVIFIFLQL